MNRITFLGEKNFSIIGTTLMWAENVTLIFVVQIRYVNCLDWGMR